ncbi:hypothetical protein [Brucella anthropi]|uniref:hypothetical protein n=1 Tax=Brucella anthropi TaxID=529 RepID=UPI000289B607|nr:hypothetical protein [Brucella anthropi]
MIADWKDARTHREPKWPFFGFAPGDYSMRCKSCDEIVFGVDKYAYRCLPCAIDYANSQKPEIVNSEKPQSFKSWFEERHGQYPGSPGEQTHKVAERLFEAFAEYVDEVVR